MVALTAFSSCQTSWHSVSSCCCYDSWRLWLWHLYWLNTSHPTPLFPQQSSGWEVGCDILGSPDKHSVLLGNPLTCFLPDCSARVAGDRLLNTSFIPSWALSWESYLMTWWAFLLPLRRSTGLVQSGRVTHLLSTAQCPWFQIPQHSPPPKELLFLHGRDFLWSLSHDRNKTLFSLFSQQCLSLQSAIVSVSAGVTVLIMGLTHSGRKVADTDRNSLNVVSMWLDQRV